MITRIAESVSMTLFFDSFQTVAMFLAILVVNHLLRDGQYAYIHITKNGMTNRPICKRLSMITRIAESVSPVRDAAMTVTPSVLLLAIPPAKAA
jgi:hypothetical protein